MRPLRHLPIAFLAGALSASALAPPAAADHADLPRGRDLTTYTVKDGDTATGLAARFHAWTAELIAHNHLGSGAALRVGQRIEIPVVVERAPKKTDKDKSKPEDKGKVKDRQHADPSREKVRRTIVRVSRRQGVDPQLALAVSWQEAGWQMHHVSSANAIGAMQVLPATARWMEYYAGRRLRLHELRDNVTAGVLLLRVLDAHTSSTRHQLAAYYQGLGAVREHGLYAESRAYVANVLAIKQRLEKGLPPA